MRPMTATRPTTGRPNRSATGCASRRPPRRPAAGRPGAQRRVDVAIVGAGFTGLWTAIALTDTDPVAAGRRPRGGDRGVRGDRPERRLLRGEPDPRPGQRHQALPRRAASASSARASTTSQGLIAFTRDARHRLRPRGDRDARPGRPGRTRSTSSGPGSTRRPSTGSTSSSSTARPPRPRSTPRCGTPGCTGRRVATSCSTRPSCVGASPGSRASAAWRIHERTRVTAARARGRRRRRPHGGRRRRSGPATWSSPRRPTPAGCAACRRCSCRSTTTCWCPSRSRRTQRESIGWERRQGLSDANNQFHYFRLTADDRILWGGYDAIHHFGSRVGPELDQRPATFEKLEAQFFRAFPQLEGLRFPYRWGGAIDTTSRFTVTFGQTMGGRVTYALGYTGLGVGASRWAGRRRARLHPAARRGPPPAAHRHEPADPVPARAAPLARRRDGPPRARPADRNEGRRGLILQTLDALGIGFDS